MQVLLSEGSTVNRAQTHKAKWKPPVNDKVKINFDSAYDSNNKTATSGILIRGSDGEVLGSGITKHCYVQDLFVGEALAAVAALKFRYESLFRSIELEGDNLTVIKKLKLGQIDKSKISPIISDGLQMAKNFLSCDFLHVRREANRAAHLIARAGINLHEDGFFMEEAPSEAAAVIIAEQRLREPP
ncbi:hypothetical protein K2173_000692 [Erythroxylum novogranatense]|uniref:RNase H type-1 domain-containing protein n=1 Tax=Erythroxylum novogranatense TaxID=1862640 RepID=A0AAV8SI53_9ROSI|nr:hypothetical protein K2173_000692 [Erythroxylum novogranatense]